MNKLFYLFLGLSLVAFQVVEVEAQRDGRDRVAPPDRGRSGEVSRDSGRDVRGEGRDSGRDVRGTPDRRPDRGRVSDAERDARYRDGGPPARRGDGRVTDRERDARYRDGGAPARDTRVREDTRPPARDTRRAPVDTRVREDTRPPARDTRVEAPSEDTRGGGLSKRERVEACKKQYGKKKKNKAAKQACIAAAKGR